MHVKTASFWIVIATLAGALPASVAESLPQEFASEAEKLQAAASLIRATPFGLPWPVEQKYYIQRVPEAEPGWCERALKDFRELNGVEAVEPVKTLKSLPDTRPRSWDGFCPNLINSKLFDDEWVTLWYDYPIDPGNPPADPADWTYTAYFYTTVRNLKLFREDFDHNPRNGEETVLAWRRTFRVPPPYLPPALSRRDLANSDLDVFPYDANDDDNYALLNFDRHLCSFEYSGATGEIYSDYSGRKEYLRTIAGIVRYRDRLYFYGMSPEPNRWDLLGFGLARILQLSPGPAMISMCSFEEPDHLTEEEKGERELPPRY